MIKGTDGNPGSLSSHHPIKMTREQFEKWLDDIDSNNDGNISRQELRAALKVLGLHWNAWKAWRAVNKADLNHNKVIDGEREKKLLIDYAAKHWKIIVTGN